ncbi:MAG: lysine--tRNA ligase [Planctomycetota bacterium]|nr:lysine--tRNA ligase [Planctomycetota bacterium]
MTDLAQSDRVAKAAAMRAAGVDPFPARGVVPQPISELLAGAGTAAEPGPLVGKTVTIAGRLLAPRDFGKLIFAPIVDRTGRVQIGLRRDSLTEWWPQRKWLDAGDQLGVTGELGFTQKGEITVWASEVKLLAKSYAPPPEKWHGLADVEQRYRRRYVDLWATEGVMDVFIKRSKIVSGIRRFLEAQGYLEVETPTLHPIFGGATARPFVTHHNALGCDFYLRIAPELYLKRLIVGGLERVFEIARNFRNEGISTRHNPEFSMLELYEAQADYRRMMEIAEQMLERLALDINGTTKVTFRGAEYDLKAPFQRVRYPDLFRQQNGCEFDDEPAVRQRAKELGLTDPGNYWKLMNDVFEATCEKLLTGPVFCTDYPVPICPLAKTNPHDPKTAERFELFLGGMELGNAFTELNDPAEQERRFEEQVASKDEEAPGEVDVDYVQALEYGMPPTGGLGIGIDRLVMVLTGQDTIRDVLLFPAMRPLSATQAPEASAEGAPAAAKETH